MGSTHADVDAIAFRTRTFIAPLARIIALNVALVAVCATPSFAQGRGGTAAKAPVKVPAKEPVHAPAPRATVPGGAWSMPDHTDLVEKVIRRIVTQDKPASVPIAEFNLRAFGREATLAAVREYLGRNVELPASVYASVAEWTDAKDMLPQPPCIAADSTCIPPSTVWLAVTKFEKGDLPHEMNVWYTTAFSAKPHDQVVSSRYSFCERWLRIGGVWKYDGFIRVKSGG